MLLFRYNGINTATALVSNTLLLVFDVVNQANITFRCWSQEEPTAVSLFAQKLVRFNTLDRKVARRVSPEGNPPGKQGKRALKTKGNAGEGDRDGGVDVVGKGVQMDNELSGRRAAAAAAGGPPPKRRGPPQQ